MTTTKLHYDGWLALPAAVRQAVGLDTGDVLEVQVADGRITLSPVNGATRSVDVATVQPAAPGPDKILEAVRPQRRRRIQLSAVDDRPASLSALPPALRARGRRKVRA